MTETIAVQRDEYLFGVEDGQLTVSEDHLVHTGQDQDRGDADRIFRSEVTGVSTTVDESVTGFRTIGIVLGLFALLFTGLAVRMVLQGKAINLITAGTALSAGFGWLGAVQYYRADRGALAVLKVQTGDEEYVFYTQCDTDAVERIAERIRGGATPEPEAPGVPP